MSSVYYSDDIRNNCESCEDFDTFIDECVDSFIDRDGPEAMAYDVPEFIAENVDEYNGPHVKTSNEDLMVNNRS